MKDNFEQRKTLLQFNHEFCAKKLMSGACFVKIFLQKTGISGISDTFSVK